MSDFLNNFINEDLGNIEVPIPNKKKSSMFIIDNNDKRPNLPNKPKPKEHFLNKDDSIKVLFKARGFPEEEIVVNRFKKTPNAIIGRSIILYGPSGSGKTYIVRDLMNLTKTYFPMVFAFVPTNAEKHDYDSLIPKPLVYETFGLKEIKDIYVRQKSTTEIYNNANNLKTLHCLFDKIASPKAKIFLKKLLYFKGKAIKEAEQKCESLSEKKNKREEIEAIFKEKLIRFYKQVINPNVKKLQTMNLSQEEKFALRYRNLNPKTLILFDDAFIEVMKLIREGKKKDDETIKNFFFKGRWANITHWYAFQDDNRLDSDIRKNAFISVFTDKQVANAFFGRTANSFTPLEKKRAEAVINAVFSEETAPKHAKLIYSRLEKNKFSYIVADEYPDKDVQMCSKSVREYCKKIAAKENNFDTSNPFFSKFMENLN